MFFFFKELCLIALLAATRYLLTIIKISEATFEFLVLSLVEMNRLSCDSYLARGKYHLSLEIVLQKEVCEGDWKCWTITELFVSVFYRNHRFDGSFLTNGRIVFQNGDYIFKLHKSSKNSTDEDFTQRKALR